MAREADTKVEVEVEVESRNSFKMDPPTVEYFRSSAKRRSTRRPTAEYFSGRRNWKTYRDFYLYLYPPPGREDGFAAQPDLQRGVLRQGLRSSSRPW